MPYLSDAEQTPRLRALRHAMDFRETFRELTNGCVCIWHRMRGIETDTRARREAVLEGAFGQSRTQVWRARDKEKDTIGMEVDVEVDRLVMVEGERQWLGIGDNYGYGLMRRERSDGLEEQIDKELSKRGYAKPGMSLPS